MSTHPFADPSHQRDGSPLHRTRLAVAALAALPVLVGSLALGASAPAAYADPATPTGSSDSSGSTRALVLTQVETGPTTLAAEDVLTVHVRGGSRDTIPGTIRISTPDGRLDQALPVEGRDAAFHVPPGSYPDLSIDYSGGVDGNVYSPSNAAVPVSVARATMTHVSDIPAGQHLDRFAKSAVGVTPVSSAAHLTPFGHYVLLAFDEHDERVSLAEGDFDGTGQLAFDTTAITAEPGTYRVFLQTSESAWFTAKDTLLGTIVVDPAPIPTTVGLQTPAGEAAYGSGSARVVGTLSPRVTEGPVDGTLQAVVDGRRTGPVVAVRSTDPVSIVLPTLAPGSYSVKIAYSGGTHYAADESATGTLVVGKAHTATSITSTTVPRGGTVAVQVGSTDSEARGSGTVTLREGTTVVATGTVTHGLAAVRLPSGLTTGRHTFTASYDGSPTHTASTSQETAVTVTAPAAPVASRVAGFVTRRGRTVSGTLTVASSKPVTGRVQVLDGRRVVRTVTLTAAARGKVAFTLRSAKPGRHTITVRYLGSPTVKASARTWRVTVPRR
ncbi:Ig-like domain repeat protein [Nocardioides sp.]|uniref:Ig-like domain repeat protein n=1 Tax=Nocardioides sp. TaxID=35761 RepID=UPI0027263F5B|nr:Ig-like domain repeat protein [Nocardioides sp.]MDO9454666.1 Ig-like domain repeat protein [Nocardioides sp.]